MKCLHVVALVVCLGVPLVGCSGSNPAPTPSPTPPPVVTSLSGTVRAFDGTPINGATVTITTAGQSTTTANGGLYSFASLTAGSATVSAARSDLGFLTQTQTTTLNGATILNFTLDAPAFSVSSQGNDVKSMPIYVGKVRIFGDYGGSCQNFILHLNGRSVVNEIMGTCNIQTTGTHFDGTFVVPNRPSTGLQQIETLNSTGVSWAVVEVR